MICVTENEGSVKAENFNSTSDDVHELESSMSPHTGFVLGLIKGVAIFHSSKTPNRYHDKDKKNNEKIKGNRALNNQQENLTDGYCSQRDL